MTILAWHFIREGGRLRNGDVVHVGDVFDHAGPLVLCQQGLHASRLALDACKYAESPWLSRVECDGAIVEESDKLVCSRRRVLWVVDATDALRAFARECALAVVHLWDCPAVVRRYLETGDENLQIVAHKAACAAVDCESTTPSRRFAVNAAWAAASAAACAAWAGRTTRVTRATDEAASKAADAAAEVAGAVAEAVAIAEAVAEGAVEIDEAAAGAAWTAAKAATRAAIADRLEKILGALAPPEAKP